MSASDERTLQFTDGQNSSLPPAENQAAPPNIPDVTIEGELGRGGMGVVYRGRQGYINRPVAVKVLRVDASGAEFVKRFQREATILAQLNHPHVVACYQAGTLADNGCYLVMEFIAGRNLAQHVAETGVLSPPEALRVARDIASALRYAQGKGIIHRDVKAENVLLAPGADTGQPFIAKLVDLGLARPVQASGDLSLTRQGMLLGTPATMAPEQFDDPDHVDHRADIYGLGCALYQALTGASAFTGRGLAELVSSKMSGVIPDPRKVSATIPQAVSEVVQRCLAKQREDRYQNYDELIAACETALAGGGKSPTKSGGLIVGGVIAVAALLAGAVFFTTGGAPDIAPVSPATPPVVLAAPTPTLTPTSVPKPAPVAPAPPVAAPAAAAVFGAAVPLHGHDLRTALAEWTVGGGWGFDGEEDRGLQVTTTGEALANRPLPEGSWQIEGALEAPTGNPFQEAGLRIELADGSAVSFTVKNLGTSAFVAVHEHPADGSAAKQRQFIKTAAASPWSMLITHDRGQLLATVGGAAANPVLLRSAPNVLTLVARKGSVLVTGLQIRQPQP